MTKKLRFDEDEMTKMFEDRGYALIDKIYVNSHNKHRYICNSHIDNGEQSITFNNFKKGHGCINCANERKREKKRRYTNEDVSEIFSSRGLHFLENQIYKNNQQKLFYSCPNHLDLGVQEISLDRLKNKVKDGCPTCANEQRAIDSRRDFYEFELKVAELGYRILTSKDDYVNSSTPISFLCNRHGEFKMQTGNFLFRGRCPECGMDNRRGSNHVHWKGGVSSIKHYLRETLSTWKREVLIRDGFKCQLTHTKKNLEVHHLYSFDQILEETFKVLGIPIKKVIGDYTSEELNLIKYKILEIHDKSDIGITLNKEAHLLFHKTYGFGDNTSHQFDEFKRRFLAGEFQIDSKESLTSEKLISVGSLF